MRTRNADTPKSATAAKKTPPAKKSATKTPPTPTEQSATESATTPNLTETKPATATKGKQVKTNETTTNIIPETKLKPAAETATASADAVEATPETKIVSATKTDEVEATPETKVASGTKIVRRIVKRTVLRKKTSAKAGSSKTPNAAEAGKDKVEESTEKESVEAVKDAKSPKKEEFRLAIVEESAKNEELVVDTVETLTKENKVVADAEETSQDMEVAGDAQSSIGNVRGSLKKKDSIVIDVANSSENQERSMEKDKEDTQEEKEAIEITEDKVEPENEPINMDKNINEELKGEEVPEDHVSLSDERMDEDIDHEAHEDFGEEELAEDNVADHGQASEAFEEERAELNAAAEQRKIRKELEIFVGGLDREAMEEHVKKAFENVGEVVEVRLHKDLSTNKNKGYAFVRFAKKEQATRALAEMKNPVIHGKRCGTAPSEDNDTLFLGNICNTWTKEAIRQKLKDYGVKGVENITLVADAQHEGLSRGFAFLEFSCHPDAMLAYKRLQKPDVIFGHPERTAKVAFAEPLREPDPEVLSQVKSVFVDGLPPHWDEEIVREQFKGYGEIERIMLARNMSTVKRKDFGFVDYTTHEAAVACIDGTNNRELGDSKTKVRARLSNPLPKTQAVKGGMSGGFRIGHGTGRGFGRVVYPSARANFQHGRGFYQHGHGQTSRMGFANDHDLANQYPSFRGRQNFGQGGRWGSFRSAHQSSGGGNLPARFDLDRPRHGATGRVRGRHMPVRGQPFLPEEEFSRPFVGRHFDDPYYYDDNARGIKRPFFADQDPDYIQPSRDRPRLDYSDPAISLPGARYRGADGGPYSRDYSGYNYDGGANPSYYGGDSSYRSRYYY